MNKILIVACLLLSTFQLQSQCDHPDYDELMRLYEDLDGDDWANNDGWGEDCEPCEWFGIGCNSSDRVELIELIGNNLTGLLSDYDLPALKDLNLYNNGITGSIPNFSNMPELEYLELDLNILTGSIPDFSNLPNLITLILGENNLTGSIPDFSNLPELFWLELEDNNLTGSIPDFSNLPIVYALELDRNNLTGSIPDFSNMTELTLLKLNNNDLEGCYPHNGFCDIIYNFSNNPKFPFEGDYEQFCNGEPQIGAPCDDGDPNTLNDTIQDDCSCGEGGNEPDHPDYNELIRIYNDLNGEFWTNSNGWGSNISPCEWYGIECNSNNRVTVVKLDFNNLEGQLSNYSLPFLEEFYLNANQISGPILDFSGLPNLQVLWLDFNQLSGSIPDFSNLPNLRELILPNNNFTGGIPDFSNLAKLEWLLLGWGGLTGSVPDFSNLPKLKLLDISGTAITGPVPNFSNLPNLEELYLFNNELTGTIPDFSNLPYLLELNLSRNNLLGSIPDFSNLPNLEDMDFWRNNLTGSIPDFSNLPNLRTLILSENNLTGTIPDFTNTPALYNLLLDENNLTGEIPDFSNMPELSLIDLQNNSLVGAIPGFLNLPDYGFLNFSNNDLDGCYPHAIWCSESWYTFDFTNNLKLPFEGDYEQYCNGEPQIGAPCDDGDPNTYDDVIQDDCSCGGIISSTVNQEQKNLKVYPNPASDFIIIENYTRPKLIVSDVSGRNFKLNSIGNSKYDVSQLSPGLYFILATEQKAKNTVLKFIKL